MTSGPHRYHHGNVRFEIEQAALEVIERSGVGAVSIRALAKRVGVTHAAVLHHFGDKDGVLTAIATAGFLKLAASLAEAAERGDFGDVGVAYVRFAAEHRAHFDVMFRADVLHQDDRELLDARARAAEVLYTAAAGVADAAGGDATRAGIAGWAYVHGIATLWRDGNLPPPFADPVAAAEALTPLLFQSSRAARRRARRHA